ncbi:MAG: NfeD family protein [Bacteriovoracaceae bacterium]|nr:NfeD family protein [Bacteriovoracaceae bacterium]
MQAHIIWLILGAILMLLETVIPGGIVVFLGFAAIMVAGFVHFSIITSIPIAIITWFISSIFMMFVLRSFFMKFFEGDSYKQIVDEDEDAIGSCVEVIEKILPHEEGRVRFRNTTWGARSDEEFSVGEKAIIEKRDGNKWVVKSI